MPLPENPIHTPVSRVVPPIEKARPKSRAFALRSLLPGAYSDCNFRASIR